MSTFKIKIADLVIEIDEKAYKIGVFDDYLVENSEKTDILIESDDFYDVHRQIAEKMPIYRGFLMHGAAISYENMGFVFIAPSGTGKTTHIGLWSKFISDLKIINGDKPIIRQKDDKYYVFGSPWSGKEQQNSNICVPLKAIIILSRSENDEIKQIDPSKYLNNILKQVYLPSDKRGLDLTIDLINSVFKNTSVYELKCSKNDSAFFTCFEGLLAKKFK